MAVDKFTKWVEAEPVSKCDAATTVQFIKKVIFRFGFPHSIITDNGTNLSKGAMEEFCQREHIRLDVSSVAHPQSNGQAERANQEILRGIKPRLMVPLKRMPSCLGGGVTFRVMEHQHHTKQIDKIHTVFYGLWSRGGSP